MTQRRRVFFMCQKFIIIACIVANVRRYVALPSASRWHVIVERTHVLILFLEGVNAILFGPERFDDAQAAQRFFYDAEDIGQFLLRTQGMPFEAFAHPPDDESRNGQQDKEKQKQFGTDNQQDGEIKQDGNGCTEQ